MGCRANIWAHMERFMRSKTYACGAHLPRSSRRWTAEMDKITAPWNGNKAALVWEVPGNAAKRGFDVTYSVARARGGVGPTRGITASGPARGVPHPGHHGRRPCPGWGLSRPRVGGETVGRLPGGPSAGGSDRCAPLQTVRERAVPPFSRPHARPNEPGTNASSLGIATRTPRCINPRSTPPVISTPHPGLHPGHHGAGAGPGCAPPRASRPPAVPGVRRSR